MRFTFRSSIAAALLAATLVGCGTQPVTTAPRKAVSSLTSAKPLAQATLPNTAVGQDHGQGAQLLAKVRQILGSATGFQAEVMSTTEGHYQQGAYTSELRHVSEGFRVLWARPTKFRAVVFDAPSALMEGATLVTTDGVNCTARAAGLLSIVPIHAKANDPRIANARNHTFDKFQPSAQMNRLTGGSAVWTVLDGAPGATQVHVRVDNVPRLDKEIDEEILTINLANSTLKGLAQLVKGHTVVNYDFRTFSWNPKVTADQFEL